MRQRDIHKEQKIKEKALEIIVNQGFDGLSMQKLARAAGVSVATIYIYYKDREDLIQQLYTEEMKKMAEATLKNFDPDAHFEVGLKVQWLNRMNYCLQNPYGMRFTELVKHSPYVNRAVIGSQFYETLSKFAHNAIARKELIELPLEIYWSVAFAPLYQLVKFHISGKNLKGNGSFHLNEAKINQALQLVTKALKP